MEAKYIIRTKGGTLSVNCKTQNKLNNRELNSIKGGEYRNLFIPKIVDNGKSFVAYFETDGYISLYEFIQQGISPAQFAKIGLDIMETTEKIKAQVMQLGNLLLDFRYIFVNEKNLDIKYIYIPFVHAAEEASIFNVLKELPFYCIFDDTANIEFVSKYIEYFNGLVSFSALEYKKFIKERIGNTMQAYLMEEETGEAHQINVDRYIIGKGSDAVLNLKSAYVSRIHAIIYQENSKYYIEDCASTNHTYHNGKEVSSKDIVQLSSGDSIKIADVKLIFLLERSDDREL